MNFLLPPYRSFPLRPDLPAMPQKMIREHAGHHGLADRHGADADAGIVVAFCRDVGLAALAIDGVARRQDRRRRFHRKARHHRLAGRDAAQAGVTADYAIASPPYGLHLEGSRRKTRCCFVSHLVPR
jgi:hypothetical protein